MLDHAGQKVLGSVLFERHTPQQQMSSPIEVTAFRIAQKVSKTPFQKVLFSLLSFCLW